MIRESVPQTWSCVTEGTVAHGAEVGVGDEEKVGVGRAEAAGGRFWFEKFFEVGGAFP